MAHQLIAAMHNRSTVFARWIQYALHTQLIHDSLGLTTQIASQSSRPFYYNSQSLQMDRLSEWTRNLTS